MDNRFSIYNFTFFQLDPKYEKSFCLTYRKLKIIEYKGNESFQDIEKTVLIDFLSDFNPLDFIYFALNYFNFRKKISTLTYKFQSAKKKVFFMDNNFFAEYNKKIIIMIYLYYNNLAGDRIVANNESFEVIERKLYSLIEEIYNKQRIFSFNDNLNILIHKVVKQYPHFGRDFDIMKYKLKLFTENDGQLLLKKMTKEDLALYFGQNKWYAKWKSLEKLFGVKQLAQSYNNVKQKKTKNLIKIEKEVSDYLNL